jgi:dihydroorotate dehydrogenase (NAD+) catalytic subunit
MKDEGSSASLRVSQGKLSFANPVLLASGCASFGEPFEGLTQLARVGALVTKAVTANPRAGNAPVRILETPGGMMNCIGLQNPGVDAFASDILPRLRQSGVTIIVNVAGHSEEEYESVVQQLEAEEGIYAYEINLSCPNVDGGTVFATDPVLFGRVCERLRRVTERRLMPKLSPEAGDLAPYGLIALGAGMDGVTVCNTHPAMALDWRTGRSKLARPVAGLSGPALKPITLHKVRQVAAAVPELPIIASGGATCATDVVEFIRAGALAVEFGTALFHDPALPEKIVGELPKLLAECRVESLDDLRGRLG